MKVNNIFPVKLHRISVTCLLMVFLGLIMTSNIYAQKKSKVFFDHADYFRFDENINKDVQRLIGNVIIRQDSALFYCDSAYLNDQTNSFEAFSSVHIKVNDTVDVYSSPASSVHA